MDYLWGTLSWSSALLSEMSPAIGHFNESEWSIFDCFESWNMTILLYRPLTTTQHLQQMEEEPRHWNSRSWLDSAASSLTSTRLSSYLYQSKQLRQCLLDFAAEIGRSLQRCAHVATRMSAFEAVTWGT